MKYITFNSDNLFPIIGNKIRLLALLLISLTLSCKHQRPESDAYGNFESVEVLVSSEIQGKVMELNLEEGQEVDKDQIVGYLDSLPLYYKKQQLIAQVQAAEARLFQVADQVSVLLEQKDVLETELQRVENLVNEGSAPVKQLDDVKGQMRILKRQIKATESQKQSIAAEIRSLLFQVSQVQDQLSKSIIRNPIKGTVLEKYIEAGEIAMPGKVLYKLANLSELKLRVYISENQLSQIKIGDKVDVYIDHKQNKERKYEGIISWVSSKAEFTPKIVQTKEERVNLVYAVKIDVANDGYLKIGMPAEVVFLKSPVSNPNAKP